ncbi:hypothetical protein [Moritella yayanosii]|uniref:Uncharacterized protein n=1 Tax=Moritella yayanosii TaxID=69539 RepID=A0A330LK69_9GAMM|nr:hypothetical protein [Moritella yayanosii]SQD76792.1 protein of unknown function, fragment [Moritella yayanosii]
MIEFKWATYWRNSLADSDSSKGTFTKKDTASFIRVSRDIRRTGKLDLDKVEQLFRDEKSSVHVVKVVYRPNIKELKLSHGKVLRGNLPEIYTALICPLCAY